MEDNQNVHEFDCIDCGRHIISLCGPAGEVRCASCLAMPNWFLNLELKRILEPDPGWEPPVVLTLSSSNTPCKPEIESYE